MTRRCSHCSNNGHNSRTCPNRARGVKLFGVRLTDGYIRKSASMGNLSSAHYSSSSSLNPGSPSDVHHRDPSTGEENGYASDDPSHASYSNRGSERKKGIPWTEHEHRMFLAGLQKLGKGDWRGISRNFVVSRTPTQVASHAQKYFIRQSNVTRRKRRSSLFDMAADVSMDSEPIQEEQALDQPPTVELPESKAAFPSLHLSLDLEPEPPECAATSMESAVKAEEPPLIPLIPTFIPAFLPVSYPFWVPNFASSKEEKGKSHKVLRPIPVHLKEPVDVDGLLGMSTLSLAEVRSGRIEQSDLSVKLLEPSSRHSAFHRNPSFSGSDLTEKESSSKAISNEIHAV